MDINQTTWPQFGCFAAKPVHVWFATVTARQQRSFVPAKINLSPLQIGRFSAKYCVNGAGLRFKAR
jgi:hypothetical protein